MKKFKVYVLVDPIKTKIRYVGITGSELKIRLQCHISESKVNRTNNTYKNNWIRSLKKCNTKPIIRCIASFDSREEAAMLENILILKYKVSHNLVNDIVDEGKFTSNGEKSALNLKSKKVYVYNYQGQFLKEFDSIRDCSENLDIYYSTIKKCLSGEYKYAKQYQFSFDKVTTMSDLSSYSRENWVEIELLNTETGEILKFPTRKQCIDHLQIIVKGTAWRDFLGKINQKYGNKYKVKKDGVWTQSTYYNTGVKVILENVTLFFDTKKDFGKHLGLQGGFTQAQLEKFIKQKLPNNVKIIYSQPLIEVTQ